MRVLASVVVLGLMTVPSSFVLAEEIVVSTSNELSNAFGRARAGDVIRLMPGTYGFTNSVWTGNDGTPTEPILVTGGTLPDVRLDFASVEALVFNNANWILENVWVNGICTSPTDCQAGVGVKPPADGFEMRGCRVTNWTQHVKASRTPDDEADDASIIATEFYNDVAIDGSVIDVVGGKRWYIADNFVHDFGGDMVNGDYGIFLKGATSDGIIERNLVICGHLRPSFGIEVGISMGGGGTGFNFCPNSDCSCEDFDSIARNNIVLNCSDAGLHTKRACGSKFFNNAVVQTGGGLQIQENGAGSPVQVRNNILGGGIFGANNLVTSDNLENAAGLIGSIYRDPLNADFRDGTDISSAQDLAPTLNDVTEDYCGTARVAGMSDLGPIEFPAACTTFPWGSPVVDPRDGGAGVRDGGAGDPRDGGPGAVRDGGPGAVRDGGPGAVRDAGVSGAPDSGADPKTGDGVGGGGCACTIDKPRAVSSPAWLVLLLVFAARRRRQ